jgi:hypothetical protein
MVDGLYRYSMLHIYICIWYIYIVYIFLKRTPVCFEWFLQLPDPSLGIRADILWLDPFLFIRAVQSTWITKHQALGSLSVLKITPKDGGFSYKVPLPFPSWFIVYKRINCVNCNYIYPKKIVNKPTSLFRGHISTSSTFEGRGRSAFGPPNGQPEREAVKRGQALQVAKKSN